MNEQPSSSTGTLYIVATPIGNLEDITLRAIRILGDVDCIAAEDTRHTKKLLNHLDIRTPVLSYYREKEQQRSVAIMDLLREGKDVALVSDAGTPCISDPGSVVVQAAHRERFRVVAIPGPSALTAALSCAGVDERPATFYGFAPSKKSQRRQLLKTLLHSESYSVFYESPHRITGFLRDAHEILGNRQVFMARELTKTFEETVLSDIGSLLEQINSKPNKGEYVIIFMPGESAPPEEMDLDDLLRWYRDKTELSMKDCCKKLAADLGMSRSQIYKRALEIFDSGK